jgi:hypothetical protein
VSGSRIRFEVLERRRMLSHAGVEIGRFGDATGEAEAVTVVDGDGTMVRVRLSGGGSGSAFQNGNAIDLELSATTPRFRFTVQAVGGGDGRATVHDLIVNGSLAAVNASTTDVTGNVSVAGTVRRISLGHLGDGVEDPAAVAASRELTVGGAGVPITLRAAAIEELSVVTASPFRSIRVTRWLDRGGPENRITAPWIGSIQSGDFSQGLSLSGAGAPGRTLGSARAGAVSGAWSVGGEVGEIRVSYARAWSASIAGRLDAVTITRRVPRRGPPSIVQDVDLAARSIGRVTVWTNVWNTRILAGGNLGADGRVGGTAADADTFGAGDIGSVTLGRWPTHCIVAAGLNPVNGVFFDGDDVLVGPESRIGAVAIGGGVESQDVRIVAPELPHVVPAGRARLRPADGDTIFTLAPLPL